MNVQQQCIVLAGHSHEQKADVSALYDRSIPSIGPTSKQDRVLPNVKMWKTRKRYVAASAMRMTSKIIQL